MKMNEIKCEKCGQTFSRRDNMLRHTQQKHLSNHNPAPSPNNGECPRSPSFLGQTCTSSREDAVSPSVDHCHRNEFRLLHPFCMVVSGPSNSGKSFFVKDVLQRNADLIEPKPQRIIWIYKRWQPLYDVIAETVRPRVEFIRDIPLGIEEDDFLDTNVNNLIVIDDLASSTNKDPQITELFTEGSHHRNLSVVTINQNLYCNKDPTQRRNAHYLVLFKCPADKQQIMTLARQMYPGNAQHFVRHFEIATDKPYGYLLVDLKQTTPEHCRLRTEIPQLRMRQLEASKKSIREGNDMECGHLTSVETKQAHASPKPEEEIRCVNETEQSDYDMSACDDCGVLFDNTHDLLRHVKTWCPDRGPSQWKKDDDRHVKTCTDRGPWKEEDDETELPTERWISLDDLSDSGDENGMSESEEDQYFEAIASKAKNENEEIWSDKKVEYMKDGLTEQDAESKADEKTKERDLKAFVNRYTDTVVSFLQLRHGSIHTKVIESVEGYMDDGIDRKTAIRKSLRKYRPELEEFLENGKDSEDDDGSDLDESNPDTDSE